MSGICGDSYFRSAVLLVLAIALGGCSQPGGFYVVPEHKDLGVINDDRRLAIAEFEIFNGLDGPVEVKHIYPSCTCATVELLQNPIPPGESTILRVTADLSEQAGRQEFSVVLLTDSSGFPVKRVSFTALAPATGTRQRRISIGSFCPSAELGFEVPVSSFARGSVEQVEGSNDNDSLGIATHFADNLDGEAMLVVKGTAPHAVGAFSRKLQFRESIPGEPSLGEGIVELELAGYVVARWVVKTDLYVGFVSLNKDGRIISLKIESNSALRSVARKNDVASVSAIFSEDWLSLKSQSASSDRIELGLEIHEDELEHLGAVQTAMELIIEYSDGSIESYSTSLFAYIDR